MSIPADFEVKVAAEGCVYRIRYDIRAKVPLIRKKIEKYTLEQTVAGVQKEFSFTADHLGVGSEFRG